jgi:hypothetical protein
MDANLIKIPLHKNEFNEIDIHKELKKYFGFDHNLKAYKKKL